MKNHIEQIRRAGLKVTHARLALVDVLLKADAPKSVEEISLVMRERNEKADLVTIYRNLEKMALVGVIKIVNFGDGKQRYEIENQHHHHLICTSCGNIKTVDFCNLEKVEDRLINQTGFRQVHHSLEFFGICINCH